MNMTTASTLDSVGAVGLMLWAVAMWAAVGALAYANLGPVRTWMYGLSVGVIWLGVIGQLGHVKEHVAQVAFWSASGSSLAVRWPRKRVSGAGWVC